MADSGEAVQVFVRVRCLIGREDSTAVVVHPTGATGLTIEDHAHNVSCEFDGVFPESATQAGVYSAVADCAKHVVDGFNSTLFAYGQTGSGKTFTLFGPESDPNLFRSGPVPKLAGIIPRAIRDLFDMIQERSAHTQFSVYASFMQVYNENVYDLVMDGALRYPLAVHEHATNGIYVEGLSEFLVSCPADCLEIVQRGHMNRTTRSTYMNDFSSRSHSIFQLLVEHQTHGGAEMVRSKLNLVDLAGSEKWNTQVNMDAEHIAELTNINLSLHTLSRCITALASKHSEHVPYRESKLTRLLRDSLGRNCKTRVIATLSPSQHNIEESIATLKFADSAKRVMTHARVNSSLLPDRLRVRQLEKEVARLRALLADGMQGHGTDSELGTKLLALENENARLQEANAQLLALLQSDVVTENLSSMAAEQVASVTAAVISGNHGAGRESGSAGPRTAAAAPPTDARELDMLREENKVLADAISHVRKITGQFFELVIEEEQLQSQITAAWETLRTRQKALAAARASSESTAVVTTPVTSPVRPSKKTSALPVLPGTSGSHYVPGELPPMGVEQSPIASPRSKLPPVEMGGVRSISAPAGNAPASPSTAEMFSQSSRRTEFLQRLGSTRQDLGEDSIGESSGGLDASLPREGNAWAASGSHDSSQTLSFRVRGKGGKSQVKKPPPSTPPVSVDKKLQAELKQAAEALDRQQRMQEWLEAKARRHREQAEAIAKMQEEVALAEKQKEEARRRRHQQVKARLAKLKEEATAQAIADMQLAAERAEAKKQERAKTKEPPMASRPDVDVNEMDGTGGASTIVATPGFAHGHTHANVPPLRPEGDKRRASLRYDDDPVMDKAITSMPDYTLGSARRSSPSPYSAPPYAAPLYPSLGVSRPSVAATPVSNAAPSVPPAAASAAAAKPYMAPSGSSTPSYSQFIGSGVSVSSGITYEDPGMIGPAPSLDFQRHLDQLASMANKPQPSGIPVRPMASSFSNLEAFKLAPVGPAFPSSMYSL